MEVAPSNWDFSCDFEINFGSNENVSIAYSVLAVDKELQPDKVRREMYVSDGKIFVQPAAVVPPVPFFFPPPSLTRCQTGTNTE